MTTSATGAQAPPSAPVQGGLLVRHKRSMRVRLVLLVVAGELAALLGYFLWSKEHPELAKAFGEAAAGLLFGTMLGAVVQVLFNDLELTRVMRASQAEFISRVLDDLKSVYDRAERARSLILAHQSAKTYGEEVRDLVEFRVKLHNVERAIKFDPRGAVLQNISGNIRSMRTYLDVVVKEFEDNYKEISRKQSLYEADMKSALEKGREAGQTVKLPPNLPWESIKEIPSVKNWVLSGKEDKPSFESDFVNPLNLASGELRHQLICSMS